MNGVKTCAWAQPPCVQCVYMCLCMCKCVFSGNSLPPPHLGAWNVCMYGCVKKQGMGTGLSV